MSPKVSHRIGAAVAVALLALASPAGAQSLGAKLGGSRSSMSFSFGPCPPDAFMLCVDRAYPNASRRGVAGGVFARLPVSGALSLQPELLYAQKGFEVTNPKLHVDYLEVPLLVRADARGARVAGFHAYLFAGPTAAIRISCRLTDADRMPPDPARCGRDRVYGERYDPRRFDFGGAIGGGVSRELGRGSLELEVRHTRGLADTGAWERAQRSINRAASLLVGYSVPLAPRP